MKALIYLSLIVLSLGAFARDPGTGSNPTSGPGPATPDASPGSTSVMGGGTPSGSGINNPDVRDYSQKDLDTMYKNRQDQEDRELDQSEVTNQRDDMDTIED